jgi:flagellar biosynthetic protein FliR
MPDAGAIAIGWHHLLVYLRLQSFLLILPVTGERLIPARVRVSLAMALTPLMAEPFSGNPWPDSASLIALHAGGEILIGLVMGILLRLLALSLTIAASAIASAVSLSQILGIQQDMTPHPIGNLIHLAGMALLLALGLPAMLIQLIWDSFLIWPPNARLDSAVIVPGFVDLLARSFSAALILAAPFTLGSFLFHALSAVVSRVMPALPISFISAVTTPLMIATWSELVLDFVLPGM